MRPARLRALGNSVVPQCAYVVGRYVADIMTHGDRDDPSTTD